VGAQVDDETLDPRARISMRAMAGGATGVVVEILFHADLTRIGARAFIPDNERSELDVGRDGPIFDDGRPLADPCISRRQLTLRREANGVRVERESDARRAVEIVEIDRTGTTIAIGDRALLRVERRTQPTQTDTLGIVGNSAAIESLRTAIRALASTADPVLVHGETGVGKELVARALHDCGRRRAGPFVAVNCAGLPETLIDAELFGYVRGAFSGATSSRDGLFRAANEGTIFLDEIGELPMGMQAKLLRVLQERRVRALGDTREVPFDAKVVCATNRDLAAEVASGRFRTDLYARIEAPAIHVAPLRERKQDIPALFVHMLRRRIETDDDPATRAFLSTLFRAADDEPAPVPVAFILELLRHDWPRNVRELERHVAAVVAASVQAGEFTRLTSEPTVSSMPSSRPSRPSVPPRDERSRPSADELLAHLDAHDYVQHQVARAIGVSRTTLDKWMRELSIARPKELGAATIRDALASAGSLDRAARVLRVSARGLKLRMTELGLPVE
jgi:transcriptional regulator with PAS, ATPase and Fis domain